MHLDLTEIIFFAKQRCHAIAYSVNYIVVVYLIGAVSLG